MKLDQNYYMQRAEELDQLALGMAKDNARHKAVAALLTAKAEMISCAMGALKDSHTDAIHAQVAIDFENLSAKHALTKASAETILKNADTPTKDLLGCKPDTCVVVCVNDLVDLITGYEFYKRKAADILKQDQTASPSKLLARMRKLCADRLGDTTLTATDLTGIVAPADAEDIPPAAPASDFEARQEANTISHVVRVPDPLVKDNGEPVSDTKGPVSFLAATPEPPKATRHHHEFGHTKLSLITYYQVEDSYLGNVLHSKKGWKYYWQALAPDGSSLAGVVQGPFFTEEEAIRMALHNSEPYFARSSDFHVCATDALRRAGNRPPEDSNISVDEHDGGSL